MLWIAILFLVLSGGLFWVIIIRPIYTSPTWVRTRAEGATVWAALERFRTTAAAKLTALSSFLVMIYDLLASQSSALGIDWTPITHYLPAWVWPFITLAMGLLFMYLRQITTKLPAAPGVMIGKAPEASS